MFSYIIFIFSLFVSLIIIIGIILWALYHWVTKEKIEKVIKEKKDNDITELSNGLFQ